MRKFPILNIYNGLNGDLIYSIDSYLLRENAINEIISNFVHDFCLENNIDLQIRVGFKP